MVLVYYVYDVTKKFPKDELYGLVSQMRRAAVSIASNIAEGKGRASDKDLVNFLGHSRGSVHELHTQLLVAVHAGYLKSTESDAILDHIRNIGRMLNGLITYSTKPRA